MEIYFVTSRQLTDRPLVEVVQEAVAGGVDVVQIREKDLTTDQLLPIAEQITRLCQQAGIKCLINSNLEVARQVGADGVHLGGSGPSIQEARQTLGTGKLIGRSVHSVPEAMGAEEAGADYLIAGHIYQTNSKPGLKPRGLTFLTQVVDAVSIPVYAIGGITPERMTEVGQTGVQGVAILSGIMGADDPARAAASYKLRKA